MPSTKKKLKTQTRLKAIRTKDGLSLSDVEALTGVSKAMLGQIERCESSPTLETLWKLSTGLHMPLSAIVGSFAQSEDNTVQPSPHSIVAQDGISIRTIFPFSPALRSETLIATLEPGKSHSSSAHTKGVVEEIFVLEGTIEVSLPDLRYVLAKNECLRFSADKPHAYKNPNAVQAEFLNTIYYLGN